MNATGAQINRPCMQTQGQSPQALDPCYVRSRFCRLMIEWQGRPMVGWQGRSMVDQGQMGNK